MAPALAGRHCRWCRAEPYDLESPAVPFGLARRVDGRRRLRPGAGAAAAPAGSLRRRVAGLGLRSRTRPRPNDF